MRTRALTISATAVVALACGTVVWGQVAIDWVPIGNAGNAGEPSGASAGGYGPDRICGAVDYEYDIGKSEVTAGQYSEFLKAVAATDTYELYHTNMWNSEYGCKIQRSGSPGGYTYSAAPDWADRPVNYVSWAAAARFCNWLTNDQPTGNQDLSTTEDGSYYLNGAMTIAEIMAVSRKTVQQGARYVIPSEDEWYKAAYHKNDGVTGDYWDYPTGTDAVPSNDLIAPDPGNNANFYDPGFASGYTIGSPYYRTEVGEFEESESPYDTFDQGGNVWEWNEAILGASSRGVRGGSYGEVGNGDADLHAAARLTYYWPTQGNNIYGFRVAYIPEPATGPLLALSAAGLLRRRRRRQIR